MALPFLTAGAGGGEATEFPRHSQRFSFFRRGCGPEGSPPSPCAVAPPTVLEGRERLNHTTEATNRAARKRTTTMAVANRLKTYSVVAFPEVLASLSFSLSVLPSLLLRSLRWRKGEGDHAVVRELSASQQV